MSASRVDPQDFAAIEAAIRPETQLMYFEAITNPLLKIIDIPRLAEIANAPVGFPEIRYALHMASDATPEQLAALQACAVSHSPNAQTITTLSP